VRRAAELALEAANKAKADVPEQPSTPGVARLIEQAQTEYAAAQPLRLKDAAPVGATAASPGRIYIQIQVEEERASARQIETVLEAQNFVVPGIERINTGPTTGAEVRFFRKEDQAGAERIVKILHEAQIQGAQAKYLAGYEGSSKIRPKHYEIWFAPGTLP
jgi:hypothetical protein